MVLELVVLDHFEHLDIDSSPSINSLTRTLSFLVSQKTSHVLFSLHLPRRTGNHFSLPSLKLPVLNPLLSPAILVLILWLSIIRIIWIRNCQIPDSGLWEKKIQIIRAFTTIRIQTTHTTTKPASPHLSLRHLIQSYHTLHPSSSNGYTPSTLLHQTSPQPCNTHTYTPTPLQSSPTPPHITSTQYPYDLPTHYTPPTFTTHPNPYTPSTPTHPQHIHTLQHPTHPPTLYTHSNLLLHHIPLQCPKHTI